MKTVTLAAALATTTVAAGALPVSAALSAASRPYRPVAGELCVTTPPLVVLGNQVLPGQMQCVPTP